jgi:hypothetical protein
MDGICVVGMGRKTGKGGLDESSSPAAEDGRQGRGIG